MDRYMGSKEKMTDNPLTKEQIEELNRISQMPVEEQKRALPDFLKKLSPEQIEFLKKQQGGGCAFCAIVEGKIQAKKIYEDDILVGALEINPGNKGHVVLFPKRHYEILNQVEDVGHLFNVAKRISAVLFEVLKAEGTNIFVANGYGAGQLVPHVSVHIIPRFKDDKVKFGWEKAEVSEEEFNSLKEEIISRLGDVVEEQSPVEVKPAQETVEDFVEQERIP